MLLLHPVGMLRVARDVRVQAQVLLLHRSSPLLRCAESDHSTRAYAYTRHVPPCLRAGETVLAAPFNCYGCKAYLCCGTPCYEKCSIPRMTGMQNSEAFMSKYKAAVAAYDAKAHIPKNEMLIFEAITNDVGDFGDSNKVAISGDDAPSPALEMMDVRANPLEISEQDEVGFRCGL